MAWQQQNCSHVKLKLGGRFQQGQGVASGNFTGESEAYFVRCCWDFLVLYIPYEYKERDPKPPSLVFSQPRLEVKMKGFGLD